MNFFEVDWLKKGADLMKEAFLFKKYKAMHPVLAILCGILMLPLVLISFIMAGIYFVLSFFFTIEIAPIKFLHGLVSKEGEGVKHATQFAIYWIAWPVVFFLYLLASGFIVTLSMLYALTSILTFIWSFGGFRFHLFATAEDISVEVNDEYNMLLPAIYILGAGVILVLLPAVTTLIDCIEAGNFELFIDWFTSEISDKVPLHVVYSIFYSLTLMSYRPGAVKEEKNSDAE